MAPRNTDAETVERYIIIGRLVEKSELVARAEKELEIAVRLRDDEIRRAASMKVSPAQIARLVGVSRQRIGQILPDRISEVDDADAELEPATAAVGG